MNVRTAAILKRVDLALKLSSELEELMKHPEQSDYLVKLREHMARMQCHARHHRSEPVRGPFLPE